MKYELRGLSLAFAALLMLWGLFALMGRMLWHFGRTKMLRWSPDERARGLFLLQVVPFVVALAGVFGIVLPAYLAHEPVLTEEPLSVCLFLLALICLAILLWSTSRMLLAWHLTYRLRKEWQREAVPFNDLGIGLPVWRFNHPLPLIAVVGVWHPQIFVAAPLFELLSAAEMAAVLRHEQRHLTARDNFQRIIFTFCTLQFLPASRAFEREWCESVEMAADEHAVSTNQSALDLATALVKIARLFPAKNLLNIPHTVSTVLLDESGLARRVKRLTQLSDDCATPRHSKLFFSALLSIFFLSAFLACFHAESLRFVHHGIEIIVATLP